MTFPCGEDCADAIGVDDGDGECDNDRREQLGGELAVHRSSFVPSCDRFCDRLLDAKMRSGVERPTERTLRDGVPDSRAARGHRRRAVAPARRRPTAGDARASADAAERGRLDGPSDRRAVGHEAATHGAQHHPVLRLAAAQAPRRRAHRDAPPGLRDPDRARRARPRALRAAFRARAARQSLREALSLWRGPMRSPISPTSRSHSEEIARLEELRLARARETDRRRPRARP